MQQSTSSVLAAYATIKSLSDEKKYQSPYQILREFLRYIIKEDALYSFSSAEMKNHLSDHFGFSIPEAVIRTSLKNMAGVALNYGVSCVNAAEFGTDSLFEEKKKEADEYESCIIRMLSEYISEKTGNTKVDESLLIRDLTRFLTDDFSRTTQYTDLIGVLMMKTLSYAANLKSIVAETKKPLRKKSAEKTNGNYLGISSGEFPF